MNKIKIYKKEQLFVAYISINNLYNQKIVSLLSFSNFPFHLISFFPLEMSDEEIIEKLEN